MGENNDIPSISITFVHIRLIDYTLFAYQFMVGLALGESPQDDALLLAIKELRQRITTITVPEGGEQSFFITEGELVVILSALTAFIDSIFILIPQSKERDDVIKVYEALRSYLTTLFSAPSESNNGNNCNI